MTRLQTLQPSRMTREAFIDAFGAVYEHSPWVAEQAFAAGIDTRHDDIDTLHAHLARTMRAAVRGDQLELINAHPDLAGKAAVAGALTAASTAEQQGAGIHACTPAEFARFNTLNEAYRQRFGFPFIMAVRGSNRHQILAAFEARLTHTPEREFEQALDEIDKIALFRLQQL